MASSSPVRKKTHSHCSEELEGMGASLRDVHAVRDRRILAATIRGQNHWRYERIWTESGSFVRGMRECEGLDKACTGGMSVAGHALGFDQIVCDCF